MQSQPLRASSLVICIALICPPAAISQTHVSDAEAPVRKVVEQFNESWARNDASTLARLHTENAQTINRFGFWLKGRAQHEQAFSRMPKGLQWPQERVTDVTFIRPDVALVHTQADANPTYTAPDGRRPFARSVIATYVIVKNGDRWLIASKDLHQDQSESSAIGKQQ